MPLHRSCLPLACLLAGFLSPAMAIDLPPPPSDPQLQAALQQAKATFDLTSTAGYMDMPKDAKPWPCAVSELQLRRWTGYLALADSEQDDKTRKATTKALRASGVSAGDMKSTIHDVRYAPIVASCKDDKLDGPLEFIIEYSRTMDMDTLRMDTRTRARLKLTVAAGAVVDSAARGSATIQLSQKNTFKDPATEAMMQKNRQPEMGMTLASHGFQVTADAGYSAVITETRVGNGPREWMTMFTQPTGPASVLTTSYRGSTLWMVSRIKNGQRHGETRTYPANFAGTLVPGGMSCYEDGEEIKTTLCDIE
jgi:hypothetical protein